MLVCIDHGNKQIKTTSRTFTSGLMESDTRPPFGDNIMFYNGGRPVLYPDAICHCL